MSELLPDGEWRYHYKARLVRVVDGDTVDLVIDMGMSIHRQERIRLHGINAPEMHEKPFGQEAKSFLIDMLDKADYLMVKTHKDKTGKYGRYLGTLFVEKDGKLKNVNCEMVGEGHAIWKNY